MFGGKIVGILGYSALSPKSAAVCFWTYEAGGSAWLAFTDPERANLARGLNSTGLAGAGCSSSDTRTLVEPDRFFPTATGAQMIPKGMTHNT